MESAFSKLPVDRRLSRIPRHSGHIFRRTGTEVAKLFMQRQQAKLPETAIETRDRIC